MSARSWMRMRPVNTSSEIRRASAGSQLRETVAEARFLLRVGLLRLLHPRDVAVVERRVALDGRRADDGAGDVGVEP